MYFCVQGQPDPLNSAFHLTYNMVLNLLRVEEINPEYMLERSFYQFQNNSAIPVKQKSECLDASFSSLSSLFLSLTLPTFLPLPSSCRLHSPPPLSLSLSPPQR